MKRFFYLQKALLREIDRYVLLVPQRDLDPDWERVHISSCAKLGYQMAEERGLDPDLAACACAVHDYGRIITGKQENHAEAGYEPAMAFLKETRLFTEEEILQIGSSLRNHSKKGEIGTPLEEIVKDADILDFYQYGHLKMREDQKKRLEGLIKNPKGDR
jgi:uncharacterized protein